MKLSDLSSEKYRWLALVFIALGLAIVIIDNTVLNVAVPYILRDLKTSIDAIQWVISGYALIIATLLITMGRLGDMYGRKKIFLIGAVLFGVGSYIASIAQNAPTLFIGEALIEAIGAAMMLTSSLALLVTEFHGKERAIAFGIWGSVAGASAALGPLLGGYLTTYYSWRWSLRINVIVVIITILGSVFVKEAKGNKATHFDWEGMLFSCLGLFSLVFGIIEGSRYGWWTPKELLMIGSWQWPIEQISVIPFAFALSILFLAKFLVTEHLLEKRGRSSLLKLSIFKNKAFSLGLATLGIVSLGQFGIFFVLTIFLQGALGLNAFNTGLTFLWASITIFFIGPLSGLLASKIGPKYVVSVGMFLFAGSIFWLSRVIGVDATSVDLAGPLILFGVGIGMTSAQLTNVILSSAPAYFAGEASAVNATVRQVGTSIGIAIIGVVLTTTLSSQVPSYIRNDAVIPAIARDKIADQLKEISFEQRFTSIKGTALLSKQIGQAIKFDIKEGFVDAVRNALNTALVPALAGAIFSLTIPPLAKAKAPVPTEVIDPEPVQSYEG